MFALGPLGFATPWLLGALVALPVLWLILRALPPAPRLVDFPGAALLLGLKDEVPVARRTPWWLLVLRCLAVAALILGFAGPVWKPAPPAAGEDGPLLIMLDSGWGAAPDWPQKLARAVRAAETAAAQGRPVGLYQATGLDRGAIAFGTGAEIAGRLRAAVPVSWPSAYPADPEAALASAPDGFSTLWLADGLDHDGSAPWFAALAARGPVTVVPPAGSIASLELTRANPPELLARSTGAMPDILAIGPDPQGIERALARISTGEAGTEGATATRRSIVDLPPELRNRITRFALDGIGSAGAVVLADDSVRKRKVVLVGSGADERQELLSARHYLHQALAPGSDLIEAAPADMLAPAPDVIVLADQIGLTENPALREWVEEGGLLIRFAGPRMAASERLGDEPLLPVRLRAGGRDIGGALSWGDPRGLLPFAADGPFAGLTPPEDVAIRAQLMADPSPELASRSIAALTDNTPLVTRAELGKGQVVLFHVTANAEWSNLPLSGLFVQMLDRLVQSAGRAAMAEAVLPEARPFWTPEQVLDGFGRAASPTNTAPVAGDDLARGPHPGVSAGLYAAGERLRALNAGTALVPARYPGARIELPETPTGTPLARWLIAVAALLLAADAVASALIGRGHRIAVALVLIAATLHPSAPQAQQPAPETVRAAGEVVLAYVETGDPEIDEVSAQGLRGLSAILNQRTTIEPSDPLAVDLESADLTVLTFLYWPITDTQPAPSPQAYLRLNHFLHSGGMILFDTRDGDIAGIGGAGLGASLQALAGPLDIPPLAPIPQDHVLTRSFYLLSDFPGRYYGLPVWAEAPPADAVAAEGVPFRNLNDGVSPVIIGGNAWAEAWAVDERGAARFLVGRGYDGERQREMAYRFGVNLIMYALTGNYKSDQVHVPALLDRLRREEVGQ